MYKDIIKKRVEAGLSGKFLPIPTGVSKIDETIGGIQVGKYYLIGAGSGVGKTTIADSVFLNACLRQENSNIIYLTWELSLEVKLSQWISQHIYLTKGVDIDIMDVLGERNLLSEENQHLVNEAIEEINLDKVHLATATSVDEVVSIILKNYKLGMNNYVFVDHAAYVEGKANLKLSIDELSSKFVSLRNQYGITFFLIQQFNQELSSVYRDSDITDRAIIPQQVDFGDSRYTYRDADYVFGGVQPAQYGLKHYNTGVARIPLSEYGRSLTFWYLLKSRFSASNFYLPMIRNSNAPHMEVFDESVYTR